MTALPRFYYEGFYILLFKPTQKLHLNNFLAEFLQNSSTHQHSIKNNLSLAWHNGLICWYQHFLKSLVLFCSHFWCIYVISCLLHNLNLYVREMKFSSNIKWKMSSQEQSFIIALFILEKRARTCFHNSEFWMVLFEIFSFSVS